MSHNLKITVSDNHLLPDSRTILPADNKNTIKKVTSLNRSEIEVKQKNKFDPKAFNVKLRNYKSMLSNFESVCNNLKTSFEPMKHFKMDLLADNNDLKFEELDTAVKNIIEKQFGICYPKTITSLKKDHQQYVSYLKTPTIIFNNSEHTQLHLAVKETSEYISKIVDVNLKYQFWLKMVTQRDEFYDLDDVREYLERNMSDKEHVTEQINFDPLCSNLHSKFINIINMFNEAHKPHNVNKNTVIKGDEFKDKELEMDTKIKNLMAENEKLKVTESEHCKQIKVLLEELAFRNKKLVNAKSCFDVLKKEKSDLISIIKKMEVKRDDFHPL